jgi:hypothetical protein
VRALARENGQSGAQMPTCASHLGGSACGCTSAQGFRAPRECDACVLCVTGRCVSGSHAHESAGGCACAQGSRLAGVRVGVRPPRFRAPRECDACVLCVTGRCVLCSRGLSHPHESACGCARAPKGVGWRECVWVCVRPRECAQVPTCASHLGGSACGCTSAQGFRAPRECDVCVLCVTGRCVFCSRHGDCRTRTRVRVGVRAPKGVGWRECVWVCVRPRECAKYFARWCFVPDRKMRATSTECAAL